MRFLKCFFEFIFVSVNGLLILFDVIIFFFCIFFCIVMIIIIKYKGNICWYGYYIWNVKSMVGLFVKIVCLGWYWVIVEFKYSEERYYSFCMCKLENIVRFFIFEEFFNVICNFCIERVSYIVVNFMFVVLVLVKF